MPITNFKQALGLLKLFNNVESEDGVYKLTPKDGGKTTYVKSLGKWACLSDKAESLAHVVADPLKVLGGLEKNYIVSGRIFLGNVPDSLREKFMAGLKEGFAKGANDRRTTSPTSNSPSGRSSSREGRGLRTRVAGDLDQINIGWGLDRLAEKTYIDLSVTAKPEPRPPRKWRPLRRPKPTSPTSAWLTPRRSGRLRAPFPNQAGIAASLLEPFATRPSSTLKSTLRKPVATPARRSSPTASHCSPRSSSPAASTRCSRGCSVPMRRPGWGVLRGRRRFVRQDRA